MNVGFVSLGCSKNLIDTEATIGKFKENNFNIVNDEKKADIIVVNTCGFIDSAKEEAINTILEMAEYKKGRCKYLIAMGCLVQRYYDDLIKLLPEVDLFLKECNKTWEHFTGDNLHPVPNNIAFNKETYNPTLAYYAMKNKKVLWVKKCGEARTLYIKHILLTLKA